MLMPPVGQAITDATAIFKKALADVVVEVAKAITTTLTQAMPHRHHRSTTHTTHTHMSKR